MGNLQVASMTSKMTEPNIYLPIFNLEDVVETLADTLKQGTLAEMTFFRLIFC